MSANSTPPKSGVSIPSISELMSRVSTPPRSHGTGSYNQPSKTFSEPTTPAVVPSPTGSDQERYTRIPLSQLMSSGTEQPQNAEARRGLLPTPPTSTIPGPAALPREPTAHSPLTGTPTSEPTGSFSFAGQNAGSHQMMRQDSSRSTASTYRSSPRDPFVHVQFNKANSPRENSINADTHMTGVQQTSPHASAMPLPLSSARPIQAPLPSLSQSPRSNPLPARAAPAPLNAYHRAEHELATPTTTLIQSPSAPSFEGKGEPREAYYSTPSGHHLAPETSKDVEEEIRRLSEVVGQTSPQALHAVLRKHWRAFMFQHATDDHTSFILRAGLQNASPKVLERVVRDKSFPSQNILPILPKKQSVIDMCLASATPEMIQENVPTDVLDEALFTRLSVLPGKELLSWLAQAGRLGYTMNDAIDLEENVIPAPRAQLSKQDPDTHMSNAPPLAQRPPAVPVANPSGIPLSGARLAPEQERNSAAQYQQPYSTPTYAPQVQPLRELAVDTAKTRQNVLPSLHCTNCNRTLPTLSGYNYVSACDGTEKSSVLTVISTLQRMCAIRIRVCQRMTGGAAPTVSNISQQSKAKLMYVPSMIAEFWKCY